MTLQHSPITKMHRPLIRASRPPQPWLRVFPGALLLGLLAIAVAGILLQERASAAGGLPVIQVEYFYQNPCASCDEGGEFKVFLDKAIGSAAEGVQVQLLTYNTFQTHDDDAFADACKRYGIAEGQRTLPLAIINGAVLSGKEAIDSNLKETFLTEKAKLLASDGKSNPTASTVIYFFVSPCEECANVKEYLRGLDGSYSVNASGKTFVSPLSIASYNVSDAKNLELIKQLFKLYHVPDNKQKAPILFLKSTYLSGREAIEQHLVEEIKSGGALGTRLPELQTGGQVSSFTAYEWPGIFLTGLINGFNPCSISMLLFLITMLLSRNANVLKMGFSFITGKFVAYVAMGTALFSLLLTIDNSVFKIFQDFMKYILLAVAFIVSAANISDFIAAKNEKYSGIRLQLPAGLRKLNHTLIRSLTKSSGKLALLMAFALGLLISAGEFLCTGQIYLATILYVLKRSPALDIQTVGAFLIYVFGMMIPLSLLTIAVWKGKEMYNLSELARKNMPLIKIVNAAVFIVIGVILVFSL